MSRHRVFKLTLAAILAGGSGVRVAEGEATPASTDSVTVQLLFDGNPLLSKSRASFSCFDFGQNKWINCRIRPIDGLQQYRMARLSPGRYRMHILIDENENNPDSYPGDYEVHHHFEVSGESAASMPVEVPRIIHLTTPADNGRSIEEAFNACKRDPEHVAPFLAYPQTAPVTFEWDPVTDDAEYRISVIRARCDPYGRLDTIEERTIRQTKAVLDLPPNEDGEHYQFLIHARRGNTPVGVLFVHDAGTHGWDYRFRVALEEPSPRIAVLASLGAVFIFFLVSLAFMVRSGNRSLAVASFVVVAVSGWLGYQAYASYREDHRRSESRVLEAETTAADLRASLDRVFVDEWSTEVPRPVWWDEVSPPDYPIDNVGELLSAWQSDFGRGETRAYRERQFFKGAYQAILEHPADSDLVSTAIDLMAFIGRDYPHRRAMLSFGVKHFFDYDRPIDNCANCMVADRSNSMVAALASILVAAKAYEEAIDLVESFRDPRRHQVSDYAWAETVTVLAEAYWETGQRTNAIQTLQSEAHITGNHPYIDRMHERLHQYKTEISTPIHPSDPPG